MEQAIKIRTKNYFDGDIYFMGWIFGLTGLVLLFLNWQLTPIFAFLAVLILTAQYKLTINLETNEIDDFLFIIGFKTQKEKFKFSTLDHIYITQSNYTQQLNYKSISSTVRGELYNAYLKSDEEDIFLGESKDLDKLKEQLKPLAQQMKLEVINL